jgi:hypothetical protein
MKLPGKPNTPSHNDTLVGRLRQVAEERGATVYTEQPPRIGKSDGDVDLVVQKDGRRIVGKVESFCRRVGQDVDTAVALGAHLLLIITPDSLTAQACRRQLRRHAPPAAQINVIACPLGAALDILRQVLNDFDGPPGARRPNQKNAI